MPGASDSTEVADKPARAPVKTPEQLAKMLCDGLRGCSKLVVIVLLDLDEKYVMTPAEAKDIADPLARMLMRVKALRKPIRWLVANSDELALIKALWAYSIRLADPVGEKIAIARDTAKMRNQMGVAQSGTAKPSQAPVTATDYRDPAAGVNGHRPGPADFGGYAPESVENGVAILPGYGWSFGPGA